MRVMLTHNTLHITQTYTFSHNNATQPHPLSLEHVMLTQTYTFPHNNVTQLTILHWRHCIFAAGLSGGTCGP